MQQFYQRPVLVGTSVTPEWHNQFEEALGEANLPLVDALSSLLDGGNSLEEIYGKLLIAGYGVESIFQALSWFDRQGLLQEAADAGVNLLSDAEKEFYRSQMQALDYFQQSEEPTFGFAQNRGLSGQLKLKQAVVVVIGCGIAGCSLIRSLAVAGVGQLITVRESGTGQPSPDALDTRSLNSSPLQQEVERLNNWITLIQVEHTEDLPIALKEVTPDLLIYCPDRFDTALSEWLNQIALDYSVPLLFYRQRLFEVDLGPLVIPHQTACYVCYDRRRKAVFSEVEQANLEVSDLPQLNFAIGTDLLALEVIKWLIGGVEPVTYGRLWQVNLFSGLLSVHPVLKLPRCPACGVHKVKPARKLWEE
jgi:bacteriocin biosynthesis cyclodehydratase domain-containing protein